jgi:hypothetical protein
MGQFKSLEIEMAQIKFEDLKSRFTSLEIGMT